jgi:hypothetical protein
VDSNPIAPGFALGNKGNNGLVYNTDKLVVKDSSLPVKGMRRTLTVYKVNDWVTEVLYIRNKYKYLIKLAYNTLEIKK